MEAKQPPWPNNIFHFHCVSELQLWSKWKSEKMSVFSKDNIEECEHVTDMIRELSCGVNGFSMTEITDILAYISTN